jgi:DNA-binding transcriptional ArsR family regulator
MRLKHFNLQIGSQLMKALGDEARIRILNLLLAKGPLTTSDLEFVLEFTQSKTSRHLAYLRNSAILNTTKIDQWVVYTIREEVEDIISQILSFLEKDSRLKEDIATYETLYSNREMVANKLSTRLAK